MAWTQYGYLNILVSIFGFAVARRLRRLAIENTKIGIKIYRGRLQTQFESTCVLDSGNNGTALNYNRTALNLNRTALTLNWTALEIEIAMILERRTFEIDSKSFKHK